MTTKHVIGVDEAGRGPVLGPLVVAAIHIPRSDLPCLKERGVADSKQITPRKRRELFEHLQRYRYVALSIPPFSIDFSVRVRGESLNTLEKQCMEAAILGLPPAPAIIDCPVRNAEEWEKTVNVPHRVKAEHRADENYVVVGAASIIAKEFRDRSIESIQEALNTPVGSGYPSDPATQRFIQKHGVTDKNLRQTWKTVRRVKEEKAQHTLRDYE